MKKKTYTYSTEDGDEAEMELPVKMEVCHDCEGHGYVLNESMRHHAYTEDDEEFHDPEFREEYFKRGGIYDVQCPTCQGRNVEPVVDEARLTAEQKAIWEQLQEQEACRAADDAADARTRWMESGGY